MTAHSLLAIPAVAWQFCLKRWGPWVVGHCVSKFQCNAWCFIGPSWLEHFVLWSPLVRTDDAAGMKARVIEVLSRVNASKIDGNDGLLLFANPWTPARFLFSAKFRRSTVLSLAAVETDKGYRKACDITKLQQVVFATGNSWCPLSERQDADL